jgi:PhnB protein
MNSPTTAPTAANSAFQIQPYLFFEGRCEEAAEFYRSALGAEIVMCIRFKDNPDPPSADCVPSDPNKIMHMTLQIGGATVLASDGRAQGKPTFEGIALSLTVPDEAAADRAFNALAAGGQIQMPIGKTFFSPRFGMVADRFGVSWMVYVTPKS